MSSVAPTKRYCPSCGTPTFDADQRFCSSCGSLLGSGSAAAPAGAGGTASGGGFGLDGVVNSYIQDRMRDSSAVIAQQVKQELKAQVRRTAETQLRRNGGKAIVYVGMGIAGLIVVSAIVSLITGLLVHLLPVALVIIAAYIAYMTLRRRR